MNKTSNTESRLFGLLLLAAFSAIAGCSSDAQTLVETAQLTALTVTQQAQREQAIDAKDKLFTSLLGELTKSMGEQGPAKSISVCKTRAPEIAAAVGEETGVRIGRTSFKLRNKDNEAPQWAAGFVKQKIEKPVEVALPDDGLGVLLPIRLQATCTLCHGSDQQIMPDVKAAIVSSYPKDSATGFSEGDIRGYFWIEVPSSKQSTD